ncbi:AraC family transcriptional regulator [Paenibacillus tyrfis]|uniref:phosphoenolpyruvate hydrolase family protein n=1 Tax=Paenibacillus tyrfis TaxID=1501230 RepID=UPI0024904A03|nr:phosphoenolpyruvate hydrolase family protein [Paenibacillus tyrfis]GLI05440.1 AraC family transcriptional regulator [Paenibacillus tyrfis]
MQDLKRMVHKLNQAVEQNKHIIGAAVGCGLFAKYAETGGADLILVLNAGRFRLMGYSSTASLLPFGNSNEMVMETGIQEVLRNVSSIPCIFGLCATDPGIVLDDYLDEIRDAGFSGITNYPTVGLIDGAFGEALQEAGISFDREVAAIHKASEKGLFTIAFVFNEEQAAQMAAAGAHIICAHLGFTKGGSSGVKLAISLEESVALSDKIFKAAETFNPDIFKLVYGGPVNSPENAEYIYNHTEAMGYIGGSSFERIPTEASIIRVTELFKKYQEVKSENKQLRQQLDLHTAIKQADYVRYITSYVTMHLHEPITFDHLSKELHLNRNYLSQLFRKKMGVSFSEWLIQTRVSTAKDLLKKEHSSIQDIARQVGYEDASYFSRLFKKETGMTPSEWKEISHKNNNTPRN